MSTIYLYVKQHSITGLKYFGKTVQDPYVYKGSGTYWLRHLAKHGDNILTTHVWEFIDQNDATKFALEFSSSNDIVESKDWANLMIENGKSGGAVENNYFKIYSKLPKSEDLRRKISESTTNVCKNIKDKASKNAEISSTLKSKLKVTCPQCGLNSRPIGRFLAYHLDNCKSKLS